MYLKMTYSLKHWYEIGQGFVIDFRSLFICFTLYSSALIWDYLSNNWKNTCSVVFIWESIQSPFCRKLSLFNMSLKCCHNWAHLTHIYHKCKLSNEVMCDPIPKGVLKYIKWKMKLYLLLCKFRCFNFDLSYFLYLLKFRIIQYLFRKF